MSDPTIQNPASGVNVPKFPRASLLNMHLLRFRCSTRKGGGTDGMEGEDTRLLGGEGGTNEEGSVKRGHVGRKLEGEGGG